MSLINEALKKAQRQRTLDNAPLASAPSGIAAAAVTTHERAATHRRTQAPIYFGLGLLVIGVVATALVMHYGIAPKAEPGLALARATVAKQPAPAPAAPTAPPQPVPPPPLAEAPASEPAPMITFTPPAPAPTTSAPTVSAPTVSAPKSTAKPAPTESAPPAAPLPPTPLAPVTKTENAPAPTPPKLVAAPPPPATPVSLVTGPTDAERSARIYAFLSTLRLTGVRGVNAQARVLMNEKVFRLNDVVDAALGLRITAVQPGRLIFTDPKGQTYEKQY